MTAYLSPLKLQPSFGTVHAVRFNDTRMPNRVSCGTDTTAALNRTADELFLQWDQEGALAATLQNPSNPKQGSPLNASDPQSVIAALDTQYQPQHCVVVPNTLPFWDQPLVPEFNFDDSLIITGDGLKPLQDAQRTGNTVMGDLRDLAQTVINHQRAQGHLRLNQAFVAQTQGQHQTPNLPNGHTANTEIVSMTHEHRPNPLEAMA